MKTNLKITKQHILIFAAIAVAIIFFVVIIPNSAEEVLKNPSEGLEYNYLISPTEYYVVGVGTCKDKDIVIPEEYNGYPVVGIYFDAFYKCEFLESIYLPDSIVEIRDNAFAECVNLKKVRFSENLECIADNVFSECRKLEKIDIPNGCISIGDEAFSYCDNLAKVELPKTIEKLGRNVFFKSENVKIYYSGSMSDWNDMYIKENSNDYYYDKREIKVCCSNGIINWSVIA